MNVSNGNTVIRESDRRSAAGGSRPFMPVVAGLLALLVGVWGCSTRPARSEATVAISDRQPLLILPFVDLTEIYGETSMIKCPLCANYFAAGHVAAGAAAFMTEALVGILKRTTRFRVSTARRSRNDLLRPLSRRSWERAERAMLMEIGRSAGTELVMTGYIYRFEQRVGKRYAVESPASVALSVHMISAADGRDLWYGTVDETQSALTENLFKLKSFLKRKGTWITAEDMAETGLETELEKLPLK